MISVVREYQLNIEFNCNLLRMMTFTQHLKHISDLYLDENFLV